MLPVSGALQKHREVATKNGTSKPLSLESEVHAVGLCAAMCASPDLQLNTSGAICTTRPMISHNGAYSTLVSPTPNECLWFLLTVKNKFHSPAAFAFAFSSSMIGGTCQGEPFSALRAAC